MMCHDDASVRDNQGCNSMQKIFENIGNVGTEMQIFMIFIFRVTFLQLYVKIIIISVLRSEKLISVFYVSYVFFPKVCINFLIFDVRKDNTYHVLICVAKITTCQLVKKLISRFKNCRL